ncbi:MAG: hypothetical protein M3O85_09160 [Acidobacteriota bacterium]|nr:hypothetical protein [Acidobacteriota bacterium]
MSRLIGLAFAAALLLPSANPVREQFAKYKAIEAYEIRPGILMIPSYAEDGQVCKIGLERRHYSPEVIRLDSGLSRKEIEQIVDELAPVDERGSRTTALGGRDQISEFGHGLVTSSEYENISIQIYSAVFPTSKKHEMVADDIAATIRWNNRKCH